MADFSSISSIEAAEDACKAGRLTKTLLFPAELGGQDLPENVVYVPQHVAAVKDGSNDSLFSAVRRGLSEVEVVPNYRDGSFVPGKITITAAYPGESPEYQFEIEVW